MSRREKNHPQPQSEPEELKTLEIPPEIQRILETNYAVPEFSDEEPEQGEDLTLDVVQKPVIIEKAAAAPVQPEGLVNNTTVEDFLKNTLAQLNLVKTLNQFQSEYLEISQEQPGTQQIRQLSQTNSQLLEENIRLKFQIDQLKLSNEKIVEAADKAKEQFTKLRQQRDFHRTKHRHVVQEKQALINDLRRLREHCQLYQPLIMELNARYDKLLRAKQLSDIAREKATNELKKLQAISGQTSAAPVEDKPKTITLGVTHPSTTQTMAKPQLKATYTNVFTPEHEVMRQQVQYQLHQTTLKAHDQTVSSVAFHRNLPVFATSSADGCFKVFTNFNAPQPAQLIVKGQPHDSFVTCARFNPVAQFQSILATCGGDGGVKLYNIANQTEVGAMKTLQNVQAWSLDWHCEGSILAVGSSDRAVRLYDVNLNTILQQYDQGDDNAVASYYNIRGAQRAVTSVAFQPFGNCIVSSGPDGVARVFDLRTSTPVSQFKATGPCKACWDLQGQYVAIGDLDGNVQVYDVRAAKALQKAQLPEGITGLAFGNKQNSLLLGTKKGLWSITDGAVKAIPRSENIQCEAIDYNTVGGGFAVGCTDGLLYFVV